MAIYVQPFKGKNRCDVCKMAVSCSSMCRCMIRELKRLRDSWPVTAQVYTKEGKCILLINKRFTSDRSFSFILAYPRLRFSGDIRGAASKWIEGELETEHLEKEFKKKGLL